MNHSPVAARGPLLRPVSVSPRSFGLADLRRMARNEPEAFFGKVNDMIDRGELRWRDIPSVRDLFHALADVPVKAYFDVAGRQRAVQASAFPLLSGALTVAGVNDAYAAAETIGGELVTEVEDPKRVSLFANITSDTISAPSVPEGQDYPEIGAGEERYEIRSNRNGRRISITAEMIEENDVAGIAQRVDALGDIAAEYIEEQTLRRVCDIDGSAVTPREPYVLRPNGVGRPLYFVTAPAGFQRAPRGTRIGTNALATTESLDAARSALAAMTNTRGRRLAIPISQCTLLVPDALLGVAAKLLNSELEPGVENELNNWGPRGRFRPRLLSSPKLDDLSTTTWYMGWFQKQFVRKWKLRLEYVTLSGDTESFLRSRIAFQARIGWDVEIGATDYVYVVQSLADGVPPTP